MTESECGIHRIMMSKMENDKIMRQEMIKVMSEAMKAEILGAKAIKTEYNPITKASVPSFI